MDAKNKLQVFETPGALMEAVADFIVDLTEKSVAARGRFVISLSGGNTPEKLYSLLSTQPFRNKMPWGKTFIFWGDERCVPLDDKRNNAQMAKSLLLDKIEIPASNIFRIPVNLSPAKAAKEYEKTLHNFFSNDEANFDLILLGLGENGHTASLFPDTQVLHESLHWVKEVYVEGQKMFRITMTVPLINKARNIVFLVSGNGKAEILKTILTSPFQPEMYPAQLIKPENGKLHWFVDKDAAALCK